MKTNRKYRVLYFIQLPPPVHGVSLLNEIIFNSKAINYDFEKKLLKINFSNKFSDIRKFSLKKLLILIKLSWHLILTIYKFNPDVVYFSLIPVGKGFIRDAWFVFLIKASGKKILLHLDNRGIPHYYNKFILLRIIYRFTFKNTYVIHVSKRLLETEILSLNFKIKKAFILENTIPDHKYYIHKIKQGNAVSILFLSNYLKAKGLDILLKAVKTLIDQGYNIKLNTYGSIFNKNVFQDYKDFVVKQHIESYITINGPVFGKDKYKILAESDIFVFPSYFEEECFPLSILEAMQARLAIITTNIGAIPEIIRNNKEGLLIEPHDSKQLADKLDIFIKSENTRRQMGFNAYLKFNMNYSSFIFEKKLKAVFEITKQTNYV